MPNLIIAIDGPAGSGKSTSAKLVAERLNYLYIDTGAMYRAVTYLAMKNDVLKNDEEIIKIARDSDLKLQFINGSTKVFVAGEDVTLKIRSKEVNHQVSYVSKIEGVRKALIEKQQNMAENKNGVVMEGRDIGTVVFPNADVKIFLTASIEQRAKRRLEEFQGNSTTFDEVKNNLLQRDIIDSTRDLSPLIKADDAYEIDTSSYTISEQVELILQQVKIAAQRKGIQIKV